VRWTSYVEAIDRYQGELIGASDYSRLFMALRGDTRMYDFTRLDKVVDAILQEAVTIADGRHYRSHQN